MVLIDWKNIIKLNYKYYMSTKIIVTTKIFLSIITLSFAFLACDAPKEKDIIDLDPQEKLLEAERELLKQKEELLEQERINLENQRIEAENDAIAREKNFAIKRLEQKFLYVSEVYVKVNKTYFHSQPDPSTQQKAYLVSGDTGSLTNVRNGFGYIEFYNSNNGKSTNGWIRLNDLEEYYYQY